MAAPKERRRHPRKRVDLPVVSKGAPARAVDLSESGVFLRTQGRSTLGETFDVEIPTNTGKGKQHISAKVQVARVTADGVGAYFTQLDPDSALLLNYLLSH